MFRYDPNAWSETHEVALSYVVDGVTSLVTQFKTRLEEGSGLPSARGHCASAMPEVLKTYIRVTRRAFFAKGHFSTLELASVAVAIPYRGAGLTTRLLDRMEALADAEDAVVMVESVISSAMHRIMRKRKDYVFFQQSYWRFKDPYFVEQVRLYWERVQS